MIKLKPLLEQTLLREYVDTDIVKLWKYLDGTLDTTFGKFGRFGEIARKIGYKNMIQFFIENSDDTWWGSYDFSDEGTLSTTLMRYSTFKELETKKKGVYQLVLKWYEDVFNNKPGYIQELYSFYGGGAVNMPSWIFLKKPELVKNQWLVHGTTEDDVDSIKRQGFIKGVKDFKKLGLTTFWDGESAQKSAGGYNFAFTVSDFDEYGMDSGEPVYGDGTILVFRASGIRSYHISDSQWQTIFNGKTATDIVPIYSMMGSYVIYSQDGKKLFMTSAQGKSEAIDAVNWVVDNYDQYRKSIGWEKKPR